MFKGFLKDDFFDFVNVGLNADELIFTVRIGTKSNRSAQFGSFQINDRLALKCSRNRCISARRFSSGVARQAGSAS